MRVDNSTGKGGHVWSSLAARFTECTWSLEAVTCISKVRLLIAHIRLTILATTLHLVSKPRYSVRVLRPAKTVFLRTLYTSPHNLQVDSVLNQKPLSCKNRTGLGGCDMLTRTQALEGGANVTCISKV